MSETMTIEQLPVILREHGLDGNCFRVNNTSDQTFSIVVGYGRWSVFFTNESTKELEQHFYDEDAACRYLIEIAQSREP